MQHCPACGSKLYFEALAGSDGIEDKCFNCDYSRAHVKVMVEPKRTVKSTFNNLVGMFKHFSVQR